MEVEIAKSAGFCFGVKRAVEMVEKELALGKRVFCLGELIHNRPFIEKLKKRGLLIVDDPEKIPRGSLFVIRSHGISPQLVESIRQRGVEVLDATCPFVRKAQLTAKKFADQGYETVICGDPEHAEVIGIRGWTDGQAIVIDSEAAAEKIKTGKPVAILSQTTQKNAFLKTVVGIILNRAKTVLVENTICSDTLVKQEEVARLARKVDILVVVGGKNSSNTTKLVQVGLAEKVPTLHIETADELKAGQFQGVRRVGIAAGASTARFLIDSVKEKIESF